VTGALLPQVIPWVAPPLVGAVVGAVVGYAAGHIGLRVLLSPRRRSGLARGIGGLAARELPPLIARVRQPASQAGLLRFVSVISEHVLALPLSAVASSSGASLTDSLEVVLRRIFGSPAFINGVRGIVAGLVSSVLGRRPVDLLGRADVKTLVTERILPLLSDPERRAALARSLASLAAGRAGGLLTDDVLSGLEGALEPVLPSAGERAALWLQSSETRQLLSERARELLPRILDKLNVVQRLLLSAGQYDRRLAEKMPEIVDDTVRSLQEVARDRSQQKRVLAAGMAALRDWRDALQKDGKGGSGADGVRQGLEPLIGRALKTLEDPAVRARVSGSLETWLASGHQTVGGILGSTFGIQEAQVVDFVSERVLTWLTADRAAAQAAIALSGFVSRFLADNGAAKIRDLAGVDAARKERLDGFLVARLRDAADRLLPEILGGIDIGTFVAERIAGLDAQVTQRLASQVVGPRLKWIAVPGAFVGFVVGLFELILKILGAG
jgi:hypothetical protein